MSEESLTQIRRTIAARADFPNRDELLRSLFGTMTDTERQKLFSQHIINSQGELGDSKMVAPLWNLTRSEFMTVKDPLVVVPDKVKEKALLALHANVTNWIAILERTRDDLARKYGEVWEDETLPSPGIWIAYCGEIR